MCVCLCVIRFPFVQKFTRQIWHKVIRQRNPVYSSAAINLSHRLRLRCLQPSGVNQHLNTGDAEVKNQGELSWEWNQVFKEGITGLLGQTRAQTEEVGLNQNCTAACWAMKAEVIRVRMSGGLSAGRRALWLIGQHKMHYLMAQEHEQRGMQKPGPYPPIYWIVMLYLALFFLHFCRRTRICLQNCVGAQRCGSSAVASEQEGSVCLFTCLCGFSSFPPMDSSPDDEQSAVNRKKQLNKTWIWCGWQ